MKTKRIVLALLVSVLAFGCKDRTNGPVEDVVEDYTVNRLPNTSDEHFQKALANLESNKGNEAAVNINHGIAELEKEGADIKGRSKTNLGKATEALLNEGKKLDAEFQAWQQKAVDYTKKSGEHLKKYYPESYAEGYWLY